MKTEAQRKARNNYRKKVSRYSLECYPADSDIIAKLEEEKQGGGYNAYIKRLIREDIARSENKAKEAGKQNE